MSYVLQKTISIVIKCYLNFVIIYNSIYILNRNYLPIEKIIKLNYLLYQLIINNLMNISKKKKDEFDNIFNLIEDSNIYINIDLFRNLFESDFFENFLLYVDKKLQQILQVSNKIIIHADINMLLTHDIYYYTKIIDFCQLLHKYTKNITQIIIYGSSSLFHNFAKFINIGLKTNIYDKIIFSKKQFIKKCIYNE